ncbi:glycosyltransferase [Aquimarina sp. AU474]|uniref:glycosyltransferase n=1 Tax=Aquimarina sp. AU474 TaxID=2108529 RepID=UPI000D6977F9|nr:glycosyltransferase [Aquimarina sp. AU474]
MKIGIIVPCYNEEKNLNKTAFLNLIHQENEFHICFVNYGSKDNTILILKEIQFSNPAKVSVVDMKKNSGKATAVKAGARYLHSRGDIKHVRFLDADLSTNFSDFDGFLKVIKENARLGTIFDSNTKNPLLSIVIYLFLLF